MPEHPMLILSTPAAPRRSSMPSRRIPSPHFPGPERQIERLRDSFSQLEQIAQSEELRIVPSPIGYEPEQVLVLETVGSLQEFQAAVAKIDGLEWLIDADLADISPDEDFYIEDNRALALRGRLFIIMFNQRGLQQLLTLWSQYRSSPDGAQFAKGRKKWASLFGQVRNIRRWGPQDRVGTTRLREVLDELLAVGQQNISIELELWFKDNTAKRSAASARLQEIVRSEGGTVLAESVIPEIRYHGLLANVPVVAVERMFEDENTQLVKFDQLMFIRPTGQVIANHGGIEEESVEHAAQREEALVELPIVALLDGFPMQNHSELRGRIIVDDPDSWEPDCELQNRIHGTAMASVVLRGDLSNPGQLPRRPIYVRPILKPEVWPSGEARDCVPRDVLTVDLVHRAVRRLFESAGPESPVAATVKIVIIAVCDISWFDERFPSPFARLIDYLAAKYNLLFLLACGNQPSKLSVDSSAVESGNSLNIAKAFAKAVNDDSLSRRILSPGESLNGLTIGATHRDQSSPIGIAGTIDPYAGCQMPSPVNSQGPGFRRIIKPDVLAPGGRQLYRKPIIVSPTAPVYDMEVVESYIAPGIKVASPSHIPGVITGTRHVRGTSLAVGFAGHLACQCYEVLEGLREDPGGDRLSDVYVPVLIKALLAHSASWRPFIQQINSFLEAPSKFTCTRLLGYGEIDSDRLYECTAQRATMLGWGTLKPDQAHLYQIPLPHSLEGAALWRRVTITLAAIGPMNPANHKYRKSQVWFDPLGLNGAHQMLQVERTEADWQSVRRGMVQHEVLEGTHATVFGNDDLAQIQVNCRADAGGRVEPIHYGLVISLEVAPSTPIPIYQEIRDRIAQPVRVAPLP